MSDKRPRQKHPGETQYSDGGAMTTTGNQSTELARSGQSSAAMAEVQAAFAMAVGHPRDEDDAYSRIMAATDRPSFQDRAIYRYPRGGQEIVGPSVNLAREFARAWRNVRYGFYVVSETDESCQVRGWAWDIEANLKSEQDATFKLLVYRKKGGWVKPDERDKRELVNKHGSICERNCLLKILPRDVVEDVMDAVTRKQKAGIANAIEANRRKVISAFASLNVEASKLERYLGHDLSEVTADEIAELRQIHQSIREGNSRWSEYERQKDAAQPKSTPKTGDEAADLGSLVDQATAAPPATPAVDPPEAVPDAPEAVEDVVVVYRERFRDATHLRVVGEIVAAAAEDQRLGDGQFDLIEELAAERRNQIRDAKGLPSDD